MRLLLRREKLGYLLKLSEDFLQNINMQNQADHVANIEEEAKVYKKLNYRKKKNVFLFKIIKMVETKPQLWDTSLGKVCSRNSPAIYASIVKEINKELSTKFTCNWRQF